MSNATLAKSDIIYKMKVELMVTQPLTHAAN
jgi:hypothetical protein